MLQPHYESRVIEAFVTYLRELQEGTPGEFEAFCARHTDDAQALRELHAHWMHTADVVARLQGQRGLRDVLAEHLGSNFDTAVTLDPPPQSADAPSRALIQRISALASARQRYRTLEEIARGGMGVVTKVWDEDLRRNLAMKVARPTQDGGSDKDLEARNSRRLARFMEEAQITSQLDHPGVVPVHDLGLDGDGRVYFTMPYLKGEDFKRVLEKIKSGEEGWSPTRGLSVLLRVCEAMAYAHSKKVIHRDLKPSNIMVGRYGQVYVMDWGLARVLGRADPHDVRVKAADQTKTTIETDRQRLGALDSDSPLFTMDGDVLGTPAYMPPEQARGDADAVGVASDVYALGAMLYYLLSGQQPYCPAGARVSPYGVWMAVIEGPPRPVSRIRPDVPAELVAICEKAMARLPQNRYASMSALAEDLRAYMEHRVVGAYETGAGAELRKWIGRNKALAATGGAAVLLTLAGLGTTTYAKAKGRRDADAERHKLLQLADRGAAVGLRASADALWPPVPSRVPEYERWVREARSLAGNADQYERIMQSLRATVAPPAGGPWTFADEDDQAYHDMLADLVGAVRAVAPESATCTDIEARLDFASNVEERSVTGANAQALWQEAISSIADPGSPYAGLEISPQLGLLPIGPDPESGLWEFAHLQTGDVPTRRADGKLARDAETAIVLVLIPGGTFYMGAQKHEPEGVNYDPRATSLEYPVRRVDVAPFFLSKYEMTQSQWTRIMGSWEFRYEGDDQSPLRPVESVSWNDCDQLCRRTGLQLPSEEQWEYAARANVPYPRWTGPDEDALEGAENLYDLSALRQPVFEDGPVRPLDFDDGATNVAVVGSYRANGFGLHDVLGNVSEWCANAMYEYTEDGREQKPTEDGLAIRGSTFDWPLVRARASRRSGGPAGTYMTFNLGLRPARAIAP